MIKYTALAIIIFTLMYLIDSTGKLKLFWGVLASLVTYAILFFIDFSDEQNERIKSTDGN